MTSARMKPRCRSRVDDARALRGLGAGPERSRPGSPCRPVVRKVRSPSRWYAERTRRGSAPSPRPSPSSSSVRSAAVEAAGLRLELDAAARAPRRHRRARPPPGPRARRPPIEVVLAQVDHGEHGLGRQQEVGPQQRPVLGGRARRGRAGWRPAGARRPAPARRPRRPATCRPWPPCGACRAVTRRWRRRPAPARARASSGRRAGRCPRDVVVLRRRGARSRWRRPRGCRRGTGCRGPRPATSPSGARRCPRSRRWRGPPSSSWLISASASSRASGTDATPTLVSVVEYGMGGHRRVATREGVVQGGLARVGEADEAEAFHADR